MKSVNLLIIFIVLSTYNSYAQKFYIGCPEKVDAKPNVGFLDKQPVDLVISDSRVIPANSRVDCDETGIRQALKNFLQSEFPSSKITLLTDTLYNAASNPDKITINVHITGYQASLSKAEWTGVVNYQVTVFDNRIGRTKKVSEEISNTTSKPNIWGYKIAKACLFTSFDKSNQDLASFVEESLKK